MDLLPRQESATAVAEPVPTATIRLVRSADQVDVVVELFDAIVTGGSVSITGPSPMLRLTFGPQHVAEQAFLANDPIPTTRVRHIGAGTSVVVVPIAADFELTVDAILDSAEASDLRTGADGTVTALEVPRGLVLTPAAPTRLLAARAPATSGDTSEVWTARLEASVPTDPLKLEAVANRSALDLVPNAIPDAATRADLVTNTTTIAPLTASRLWLSSSGAFADLGGEWNERIALMEDVRRRRGGVP